MIDAYVDGRPIPSSSSVFTSDASVYRGGGCVKCCSGRTSSIRSSCSAVSSGSIVSASSSGPSSRPSKYTRRNPSKISVWPVARSPYVAGASDPFIDGATASMSHAHLVEAGVGHLRRHRPLPDHRVQAELVAVE